MAGDGDSTPEKDKGKEPLQSENPFERLYNSFLNIDESDWRKRYELINFIKIVYFLEFFQQEMEFPESIAGQNGALARFCFIYKLDITNNIQQLINMSYEDLKHYFTEWHNSQPKFQEVIDKYNLTLYPFNKTNQLFNEALIETALHCFDNHDYFKKILPSLDFNNRKIVFLTMCAYAKYSNFGDFFVTKLQIKPSLKLAESLAITSVLSDTFNRDSFFNSYQHYDAFSSYNKQPLAKDLKDKSNKIKSRMKVSNYDQDTPLHLSALKDNSANTMIELENCKKKLTEEEIVEFLTIQNKQGITPIELFAYQYNLRRNEENHRDMKSFLYLLKCLSEKSTDELIEKLKQSPKGSMDYQSRNPLAIRNLLGDKCIAEIQQNRDQHLKIIREVLIFRSLHDFAKQHLCSAKATNLEIEQDEIKSIHDVVVTIERIFSELFIQYANNENLEVNLQKAVMECKHLLDYLENSPDKETDSVRELIDILKVLSNATVLIFNPENAFFFDELNNEKNSQLEIRNLIQNFHDDNVLNHFTLAVLLDYYANDKKLLAQVLREVNCQIQHPWEKALIILHRLCFWNNNKALLLQENWEQLPFNEKKAFIQNTHHSRYYFRANELSFHIMRLFTDLRRCPDRQSLGTALEQFTAFVNSDFYRASPVGNFVPEILMDSPSLSKNDNSDEASSSSSSSSKPQASRKGVDFITYLHSLIAYLSENVESVLGNYKDSVFSTNLDIFPNLPLTVIPNEEEDVNNSMLAETDLGKYLTTNTVRFFKSLTSNGAKQEKTNPCIFIEIMDYFKQKYQYEVSLGFSKEKFVERINHFLLLNSVFELLYLQSHCFTGLNNALNKFMEHSAVTSHGLTANKRYESLLQRLQDMDDMTLYSQYYRWKSNKDMKEQQVEQLKKWQFEYTKDKQQLSKLQPNDMAVLFLILCFNDHRSQLVHIMNNADSKKLVIPFSPQILFTCMLMKNAQNSLELILKYLIRTNQLEDCLSFTDEWGNNILHYLAFEETNSFSKVLDEIKKIDNNDYSEENVEKTYLYKLIMQQNKDGNTPLHLLLASQRFSADSVESLTNNFSSSSDKKVVQVQRKYYGIGFSKSKMDNFMFIIRTLPSDCRYQSLSVKNNIDEASPLHILTYIFSESCHYDRPGYVNKSCQDYVAYFKDCYNLLTLKQINDFLEIKCRRPRIDNYFLANGVSEIINDRTNMALKIFGSFSVFFGIGLYAGAVTYCVDPTLRSEIKEKLSIQCFPRDFFESRTAIEVFKSHINVHTVFYDLLKYCQEKEIHFENNTVEPSDSRESSSSTFFKPEKSSKESCDYVFPLIEHISNFLNNENADIGTFRNEIQQRFINPINEIGFTQSRLIPLLTTIKSMNRELLKQRFEEIKPQFDELSKNNVSQSLGDNVVSSAITDIDL